MGASSSSKTPSGGHLKSKRVHLPFGFRIKPRTLLYSILLFVGVTLFTICAPVYLYLHDQRQTNAKLQQGKLPQELVEEDVVAATPASEDDENPEAEVTTLDSVLGLHRKAQGLGAVQSVLLSGTYLEQGGEFEMKLATKAPGLVRKVLSAPGLQLTCTYDGSTAKVEISQGDQSQVNPIEDILYEHAIMLEGAFLSLAEHSGDLKPHYSLGEDQSYMERTCWTIRSQLPGGPVIHHLIESETGFERVRYINLSISGKTHQLSLHLRDFREQASFHFPHAYTLKVDGIVRGRAELSSAKYNQGVMPWMF